MNNRGYINDNDIVHSEQILDQGIPLPFLTGKYDVKEGFQAVILVGGVFEEILTPGFYYLSRYTMFRNVRSILVDTRVKQLHIKTEGEFQIDKPVPVKIDLDLTVEYKVVDPRMVATEIESPLSSLFDRVIEASRPIISNSTIEQVRKNGEGIGQSIYQRLKADQLEKLIGIEIRNIMITTIKALDAGEDVLAQGTLEAWERYQENTWNVELIKQLGMDTYLLLYQPTLYQQIRAGNTQLLIEIIKEGSLGDPSAALNQLQGVTGINLPEILKGINPSLSSGFPSQSNPPQQLPGTNNFTQPTDIHTRIKEDMELLRKLSGTVVDISPGMDDDKIPDGSYRLKVETRTNSGEDLICYFSCNKKYPDEGPLISVELNGEELAFESAILRQWNRQYLIELVREALTFVR